MEGFLQFPRDSNTCTEELKENNSESLWFDDVYEQCKSYNVWFKKKKHLNGTHWNRKA